MNTATQTPRLIDANALKKSMRENELENSSACYNTGCYDKQFLEWLKYWFECAMNVIASAPTVETTDDVLARLKILYFGEFVIGNVRNDNEWVARYYPVRWEIHSIQSPTNGFGKTTLEELRSLISMMRP